ncbi:MAG TPA: enoyl-CoA hydratase/isomerase family protein [Thermoplasmata archaeon]|nr:enoyl-CoA hydratase/isomerase family protein [Thermoplasmata archaeon]
MSGAQPAVLVDRRGSVVEIRLNRPEQLNALDVPTFQEFRAHLGRAARDDSVRAVILTGAGRAFSAGGDVAAMERASEAGTLPQFFHDLTGEQELAVREILSMSKPVLAALPGVAAGGGLSLALAADWRIGTPETLLVPAFPSLGAVPDGGLTYLLPHFLGIGLAQELLFTAARVPAEQARHMALLHEIVDGKELGARSWARADELATGPTFAYGWMKRLMVAAFSGSLETQLALERRGAVEAASRHELPEGIRAFRAKRRPDFPRSKPT